MAANRSRFSMPSVEMSFVRCDQAALIAHTPAARIAAMRNTS
jgi:hypothetical protein